MIILPQLSHIFYSLLAQISIQIREIHCDGLMCFLHLFLSKDYFQPFFFLVIEKKKERLGHLYHGVFQAFMSN